MAYGSFGFGFLDFDTPPPPLQTLIWINIYLALDRTLGNLETNETSGIVKKDTWYWSLVGGDMLGYAELGNI